MSIEEFTFNGRNIAEIDTNISDNRFMPQSRKIFLKIENNGIRNDSVRINFSYHGKLGKLPDLTPNQIDPEWTEIGLYYPWFPFNFEDLGNFTYKVSIDAPSEYEIFGIGNIQNLPEKTILSSNVPANDIVICLSRNIKTYELDMKQNKLQIFHQNFNDTLLNDIGKSISSIVENYEKWFGNKDMDITFIKSQRQNGGGYARIGGIVIGGFDPQKYYSETENFTRYFAHELAHLWWSKAKPNSWEDWLNESFAEYSALLILKSFYGKAFFDSAIMTKKEKLENTPPIWNFDRNTAKYQDTREVLYNKGPVLLNELEQDIGEEHFLKLCRAVAENDVKNTFEFLEILKNIEGVSLASKFEEKLKNR